MSDIISDEELDEFDNLDQLKNGIGGIIFNSTKAFELFKMANALTAELKQLKEAVGKLPCPHTVGQWKGFADCGECATCKLKAVVNND